MLLSIGAFAAIVVCVTVAARSIVGDPARGRRRCPRCWHELGPEAARPDDVAASRRCGECGHVAADEASTRRTRRSLGRAALAIAGIAAIALSMRARFMMQGPWSAVPTSMLLMVTPYLNEAGSGSITDELRVRLLRGGFKPGHLASAVELVTSAGEHTPGSAPWEAKYGRLATVLLGSMPRDDPMRARFLGIAPRVEVAFLSSAADAPRVVALDLASWWPDAIDARVTRRHGDDARWSARFNPIGRSGPLMLEVPAGFDRSLPILVDIKVRPLGSIDDDAWIAYPSASTLVPELRGREPDEVDASPVDSDEHRAAVARVFAADRGLIGWSSGSPRAGLQFNQGGAIGEEFNDTLFGLRIDVCEDGVPRRTSRIWWSGGLGGARARWLPPIEDASALDQLFSQDPEEDGRWTLRITGDPTLADYARPSVAERPIRSRFTYWSGSFEVPLAVQRVGQATPPRRWLLEL